MNPLTKILIGGVAALLLLIFVFAFCYDRIDAGHVGVKVNLYGDQRGVDGITYVTGGVFYNPFTTDVYEFPTFVQHKEYTGESAFIVNSKDGAEFHVAPIINYAVIPDSVPRIFATYRKELSDLEDGFIKTAVYDAFRLATNGFSADSLIGHREAYEAIVRTMLIKEFNNNGFVVQQFTSNLAYPETFKKSIESKNAMVQSALQAENQVKKAEAEAKIKVATEEGEARALMIQTEAAAKARRVNADAESYYNRTVAASITQPLIQKQFVDSWNGVLPVYGQVPTLFKSVD